jgi:hypothetical protein
MAKIKPILIVITLFLIFEQFSTAQILWQSRYSGITSSSIDSAVGVAVNNSGFVFVTGVSNPTGTSATIVTIRYNPATGDSVWVRKIKGSGNQNDMPSAIVTDNTGFVYVTGWIFNPNRDMFVVKYSAATGDTLWRRTYNGTGNGGDYSHSLFVDASGNVYITGRSDIGGAQKFTTLKYNSAGVLQPGWPSVYSDSLSTTYDEAKSIKVDGSGNVYVTGKSGASGLEDYLTVKMNSAGVVQWAKKYAPSGSNFAIGLVLDASNNVFVTGYHYTAQDGYNFTTIKYNGTTGDSMAVHDYNGPGDGLDITTAIAIDNNNNVYVTGYSQGVGTNADYETIKYSNSLALLWERRYNGPGLLDYPIAIAVNNSNQRVYVTGYSSEAVGSFYDYLTIGYNMSDGSILGPLRYNGLTGLTDRAYSVAVAPTGEVYVTGAANFPAPDGNDWLTFKYTATLSGVRQTSGTVPEKYTLEQNYPNPFNPGTTIKFSLPKSSFVTLEVYNVTGQLVAKPLNENLSAGTYEYNWVAKGLTSGVYFYTLQANEFTQTKIMTLLK